MATLPIAPCKSRRKENPAAYGPRCDRERDKGAQRRQLRADMNEIAIFIPFFKFFLPVGSLNLIRLPCGQAYPEANNRRCRVGRSGRGRDCFKGFEYA